MQAAPQPISFEIELERNTDVSPAPTLIQRLEEKSRSPLTLQMIQEKLDRAYERKAQAMASQVEQSRELSDRVGIIKERKSSQDRAQSQRIVEELG